MKPVYIIQELGPNTRLVVQSEPGTSLGFDDTGKLTTRPTGDGTGDALKALGLGQFASTTSLDLKGVISDETGSGKLVFATSPTFLTNITTPKVTYTTGVIDTFGGGSPEGVLTANVGSIYRRTDGSANATIYHKDSGTGNTGWVAVGTGDASTGGKLDQFDPTSSAELATVITDETGTGLLVYNTSPTLVTPALGAATATTLNKVTVTQPAASATLTIANTKALTVNNILTLAGTDSTVMTFPSASGTVLTAASTATLTNKSIAASQLTGTIAQARLGTGSDGSGTHFLTDAQAYVTPTVGSVIDGVDATKTLEFDISAFPTATTYTLTPAAGDSVTVVPSTGSTLQALTGVGGNGVLALNTFTQRASSIALTGQTGAIATTNILVASAMAPAGLYKVTYYIVATTAGTSGTLDLTIAWNDGTSARSDVNTSAITFGSTAFATKAVTLKANGAAHVTYAVAANSLVGSPIYSLYIAMERLQ